MKNSRSILQKHLHSKAGGFGSKLFNLLIIASLLAFPTLSHVYALQPAASAGSVSFANEPILQTIMIDNDAIYPIVNKAGQVGEIDKKWLGILESLAGTTEIILNYLGEIFLAFLLIGALLLLLSLFIRRQVLARTRSLETEVQKHKQLEELLRISEIELKEAQATAHIGSWKWDVKQAEITWSDEMFRIFGIDKNTYTGRLGDVITRVIHPDDLHLVLPSNAANIAAGPIEYRIILPDASIRNIWAKAGATIFDQDGKPAFLTGVAQDITERKQAEEVLRQSEERFRSYFNLPLAGRAITSVSAGWIDVNSTLCDMLGFTKAELMQMSWAELTHPDDLPADLAQFNRVLAGEIDGYTLEKRFIHKDGHSIDTNLVVYCVRKPDHSVDYFVALIQDFTERKRAQELLRESEENLIEAQRIAHIGSWQWDLLSNTVSWSKEMYQVFDINPETYDGKPESLLKVIYPDDIELFTNSMNSNLSDGSSPILEYRIVHQDGSIHTISAIGNMEFDKAGKPIRSNGTVQDITDRKQAEIALQSQRSLFEQILEQSLAGYWDWLIQEKTEYLSPTFKRMFGYADHELPNLPETWQKLIFPEDLPGVFEVFDRHVSSHGREPFYSEVRYHHKNGSTVWVICTGKVIQWNAEDRPVRMIGCHIDITERKLAEEALRKSEENFRNVFNTMQEGMALNEFIFDENGEIVDYRILEVNPAFEKHSEAPRDWVVGKTATDAYQMSSEYINSFWKQHLNSNDEIVTELYYAQTDRWKYISTSHPVNNRFVTVFTDITEKKLAEIALRESDKKYRLIAENTSDGIIIFGADSQIQYVSPGYLKQLGYSEIEELARTPENIYSSIHQDDREVAFAKIYAAIELKQAGAIYSYRVKHAAGHYIWREDNAKFQYDSSGNYAGAYVICRDITERKRVENQINEQLEELRRWQNITQGREDRILQLKTEINRLLIEAGKPPRFASVNGVNLESPERFE